MEQNGERISEEALHKSLCQAIKLAPSKNSKPEPGLDSLSWLRYPANFAIYAAVCRMAQVFGEWTLALESRLD